MFGEKDVASAQTIYTYNSQIESQLRHRKYALSAGLLGILGYGTYPKPKIVNVLSLSSVTMEISIL